MDQLMHELDVVEFTGESDRSVVRRSSRLVVDHPQAVFDAETGQGGSAAGELLGPVRPAAALAAAPAAAADAVVLRIDEAKPAEAESEPSVKGQPSTSRKSTERKTRDEEGGVHLRVPAGGSDVVQEDGKMRHQSMALTGKQAQEMARELARLQAEGGGSSPKESAALVAGGARRRRSISASGRVALRLRDRRRRPREPARTIAPAARSSRARATRPTPNVPSLKIPGAAASRR